MKTKNDWSFRFLNNSDYLAIYQEMTGPERTGQELDFCTRVLNWETGQRILDAPCGAGRHSLEMARRGYAIAGLDFSIYLLECAQKASNELDGHLNPPRFVRGLLQTMPIRDNTFDFAVCLFSSFGYGESDDENVAVIKEFNRVLKPGGKLVIDVMNRHFIVPRLNPIYHSVQAGLTVQEERSFTDRGRRLHNLITVQDGNGDRRQYLYRPWLFNGWELSWMASRAGMKVDKLYGNFHADEYQTESERAMMVAIKSDRSGLPNDE